MVAKTSKWKGKYSSLKDYYLNEYDPKYYTFNKYELEIDPDETLLEVESYSIQRQQREILKCANSFSYFCHKYLKILHPMHGLIPFILYDYQRRTIKEYENNRFNIISKFRQGGLTTVTLLWGLWRCLFQLDQQVMLLSKTDREATDIGQMIDRAVEHLPLWLFPQRDIKRKDGKWNDHHKEFKETGGALKFYSPEAARGKSVTFLIVDEAAFVDEMERHWKAMWPVLSTGGSCTLVSTVNGIGNWYYETYIGAKENQNRFNVIDLDYVEHPDYNNPEWVKEQKAQLGDKGFRQEVLREFLGSGDTYIDADIIRRLTHETMENYPIRKLYSKWANKFGKAAQLDEMSKGALWIWREPMDGHEYVIGVDTAEGQSENNDNSCFQVIDTATLEQVAEFYSNEIPPHIYAQVVNEVGIYYNTALVVVESNGPGQAVISELFHKLYYENLYFDNTKSKRAKPGIKVGSTNRELIIQSLQNKLIDDKLVVNSYRFVYELNTFEYNPNTKKAQAQKGKHDDAIMAFCLALYVRDTIIRDIPVGAEVPAEVMDAFKTQTFDEIRRELQEGAPDDIMEEQEDYLAPDKDSVLPGIMFNYKRKHDKVLKEFMW